MAVYRFRLDDEEYKIRRNEVNLIGRAGPLSAEVGYAYFAADQSVTFVPREEIYLGSVLRLDDEWRLYGDTRQDLANSRTVSNQIGLAYEDECLEASVAFSQTFYQDRDVQPDTSVVFQITFKTLGPLQGSGAPQSY